MSRETPGKGEAEERGFLMPASDSEADTENADTGRAPSNAIPQHMPSQKERWSQVLAVSYGTCVTGLF